MKGKEDERKRAIEKHIFFENCTRKWSKWKIPKKEQTKNEIEKKEEEKWRNRKKEDTWKNVNNDIFFKNQMVSKKRRYRTWMQNRCETQFKTIHFRRLTLICWRKRKSTKGIEKTKWTLQYEGFLVRKCRKTRNWRWERRQKKRKEREDTKQFEPGGKWNRKNMCSKIKGIFSKKKKQEEKRKTQNKVKKEKKETNKWKKCKEEDKKPEETSKKIFPSIKRRRRKKEKSKWDKRQGFKKGSNKNLHSQRKNAKRKNDKFFAKRGNLSFTKQFNQVEEGETFLGWILTKKE